MCVCGDMFHVALAAGWMQRENPSGRGRWGGQLQLAAIPLKHGSIAVKLHWVQLAQRKEGNLVVHVVVESALIPHCNSSTHLRSCQSEDSPGAPKITKDTPESICIIFK